MLISTEMKMVKPEFRFTFRDTKPRISRLFSDVFYSQAKKNSKPYKITMIMCHKSVRTSQILKSEKNFNI